MSSASDNICAEFIHHLLNHQKTFVPRLLFPLAGLRHGFLVHIMERLRCLELFLAGSFIVFLFSAPNFGIIWDYCWRITFHECSQLKILLKLGQCVRNFWHGQPFRMGLMLVSARHKTFTSWFIKFAGASPVCKLLLSIHTVDWFEGHL